MTIPKKSASDSEFAQQRKSDFEVVNGSIILRKASRKIGIGKWRGRGKDTFSKLGYSSVDKFVDDLRGR